MTAYSDTVSSAFPYRGPCGLCGHEDARHRIFDAMCERRRAGESVRDIEDDYSTTQTVVRAVLKEHAFQ